MAKMVSYTSEQLRSMQSRTDWARLRKMKDADIVYDDDSPDLSKMPAGRLRLVSRDDFLRKVGRPKKDNAKKVVSTRWEPDVLNALKKLGPNWTAKPNEIVKGWLIGAGQL